MITIMTSISAKAIVVIILGFLIVSGSIYFTRGKTESVPAVLDQEESSGQQESTLPVTEETNQIQAQDSMGISIEPCQYIADKTFSSVEGFVGGNSPNGPLGPAHWKVIFTSPNKFNWQHSDVSESGTYVCADGKITAKAARVEYSGFFDTETQSLTWKGEEYRVE